MRPKRVAASVGVLGTKSYVRPEPKGVCLIIAPWNYPLNLALGPLVSALAAGNGAIIKPSEMTPHTSEVIASIVAETFPPDLVSVVEGDAKVAQKLLALPFDHIFFTGSPAVGKLVMEAAARNLSSVTLELGGKSPTIVGSDANVKKAARYIVWGSLPITARPASLRTMFLYTEVSRINSMKHLNSKSDAPTEKHPKPGN